MPNISIVTAFYDIGRANWTPEKGFPHYLQRDVDTYMQRFSYLCQLKNDITVFTSQDLFEKVRKLTKDRPAETNIIIYDPRVHHSDRKNMIAHIQGSQKFRNSIHPSQILNPEYWNPDYVLVTDMKAEFVKKAIDMGTVQNDMVAWIDFGYCRSERNIPASKEWNYDFNQSKIHLFSYKPYDNVDIYDIISRNDVYILGAKVVAHRDKWGLLSMMMEQSFFDLYQNNFVDDDQGLWLLSYIKHPESFELHMIPDHQKGHDCFVLFNQFNDTL